MAVTQRRVLSWLTVLAAFGFVTLYLLGAFADHVVRIKLQLREEAYSAAARHVIRSESPAARDSVIVFHPVDSKTKSLVATPYFFYFRYRGKDFVYFDTEDDVTQSCGLIYSASGTGPPRLDEVHSEHITGNWYYASLNNAILNYGKLER